MSNFAVEVRVCEKCGHAFIGRETMKKCNRCKGCRQCGAETASRQRKDGSMHKEPFCGYDCRTKWKALNPDRFPVTSHDPRVVNQRRLGIGTAKGGPTRKWA